MKVALVEVVRDELHDSEFVKPLQKLLEGAEERPLTIRLKDAPRTVQAVYFKVPCFVGGDIELAIHVCDSDDCAWTVTEPRTGLALAPGLYMSGDAICLAIQKLALSIGSEGRDGYEKRVAVHLN